MPGVSFDQAAPYYDATRGYSSGVAEQIRDAIVAYTGATHAHRFLEPGIGTGRVALPFLQGGYRYTGIDLSASMMALLPQKLAPAERRRCQLVQGDIMQMPFADGAFDIGIVVHVLHLVADWRATLDEIVRVLRRPGARLLLCYDRYSPTDTREVTDRWQAILRELGVETSDRNPTRGTLDPLFAAHLEPTGATCELVELAPFTRPAASLREQARYHRDRLYSSEWRLPDAVHAEAVRRMEDWLASRPDADVPLVPRGTFCALAARWP